MLRNFVKILLTLLLYCFTIAPLHAQKRKEIDVLKKQSEQLSGKIKNINKKASLYSHQIELSRSKLEKLNSEIKLIENNIQNKQKELNKLIEEKKSLSEILNKLLIYAYKTRNKRSKTAFLLSSDEFNIAYKRYLYLRYYSQSLYEKIAQLKEKELEIGYVMEELKTEKKKFYLLSQEKTDELLWQKSAMDKLNKATRQLRSDRKKIEARIRKKEQTYNKLNKAVDAEIKTEIKELPESKEFVKMKGRLKFPMKGIITQKFGRYRHKELENVYINSNGIEISGELNSAVYAVASGKVLQVYNIPNSGTAVIIKHGNYYTVYSNLRSVNVQVGKTVKRSAKIGICAHSLDDDTHAELFFQIWKNKEKLNPENWLLKN